MIEAEKLKEYDPQRFYGGYASIKQNGIHGIYDPELKAIYTRTPSIVQGLEHILEELEGVSVPLVGEIIIPGVPFEEASGRIRSFQSTPEALFHIFNVIDRGPFEKRWWQFQGTYDRFIETAFTFIEPMYEVKSIEEYDAFHERAIKTGAEGTCVIHHDHYYQPGKRTWQWMKRVPYRSLEAKIIDILPGTEGKKYESSLGRIVCETVEKPHRIFKVGIFKEQSDQWRQLFYDDRQNFIGDTIVVEFKDLSKNGIPVQPRFKGFRWDL